MVHTRVLRIQRSNNFSSFCFFFQIPIVYFFQGLRTKSVFFKMSLSCSSISLRNQFTGTYNLYCSKIQTLGPLTLTPTQNYPLELPIVFIIQAPSFVSSLLLAGLRLSCNAIKQGLGSWDFSQNNTYHSFSNLPYWYELGITNIIHTIYRQNKSRYDPQ